MVSGRRSDGPSGPFPGRRRGSREEALRALGERIEGGRSGPVANEEGLRALGERMDRAPEHKRRRRRSGRRRWSTRRKVLVPLVVFAAMALVAAGVLYGYARYRYDQIPKTVISSEHPQVTGQPFNVLVIGSDSRVGNSAGTSQYGTSTEVGGQRSDVVMVWHIDPQTKKITIMSVPRDTLVSMVGKNVKTFGQLNRINSSYNSGPTLLVQTIQDNFGIPINHVVQVNFAGFKGAVNALGGVYLDFKYPARDAFSGLNITTPGCQLLNGTQALAVARSRHYEYYATTQWLTDPSGDLGRIHRQDAFLKALIDAAKSKYNPLTVNAFLGSLPQGIVIDSKLSLGDLVGLAEDFHSINPTTIATVTLPTFSTGFVTPWGDVLFVQEPEAQQELVSVFGTELTQPSSPPPNTTLTPTAPPDVSPSATGASGTTAPSGPTAGVATTTTTAPPTPTYDPKPCSP